LLNSDNLKSCFGVLFYLKHLKRATMPIQAKSNNIIDVSIETVAFGGSGVARYSGMVCFVPYTLPGETVRARIIQEKRSFIMAELLQVLAPSPERIAPACPFAGRVCPGCAYQHMRYECEVKIKDRQFRNFISRINDVSPAIFKPPAESRRELYYRNKLTLHSSFDKDEKRLGYFMSDNRAVLDIPRCPLASEGINVKLESLRNNPGFSHTLRDGMTVTFRETANDGVIFWRNSPPDKISWLKEDTACGKISVPAGSFSQVNPSCRDVLMLAVADILKAEKTETFIDLYCGSGLFSVAAAAAGVPAIIGADLDGPGIKAAEYNLSGFSAKSAFAAGEIAGILPGMLKQISPAGAVLAVDPPRAGLDEKTLNLLCSSRLNKIIYVSCAPDNLQRDLQILCGSGFRIESTGIIDMFPRTAHFETLTWLRRA
jgi:tRNA/tmRNA/rRNA uracil-C5-methylase (TrmA/RlmC/RlmD family)